MRKQAEHQRRRRDARGTPANARRRRDRAMRSDAMDAEMVVGTTTHVYDETLAREIASECATSGHGRKAIEKGVREIEAALKGAKEANR